MLEQAKFILWLLLSIVSLTLCGDLVSTQSTFQSVVGLLGIITTLFLFYHFVCKRYFRE